MSPRTPLQAYLKATKPYKKSIILYLILIFMGYGISALTPYAYKLITNDLLSETSNWQSIINPLLTLLIILIAAECCYRLAHLIESIQTAKIYRDSYQNYYNSILDKPSEYFENRFSGELGRRVSQVSEALVYLIEEMPWSFARIIMTFSMSFILLLITHWLLAIVFITWLFLFLLSSYPIIKKQYRKSSELAEESAAINGNIVDSFSNIQLVQSFAAYAIEKKRHQKNSLAIYAAFLSEAFVNLFSRFHQGISQTIIVIAMAVTTIHLYFNQQIGIGEIVMIFAIIPDVADLIWRLGEILTTFFRNYGEIDNALKALDIKDQETSDKLKELSFKQPEKITFQQISFQYPETKEFIFNNFNLTINAEEKVGLVGASGVGKSTLIKLLLNQYQSTSGEILIADQNIKTLSFESLRTSIAFVPQDTTLFHRSLFENIAYARPEAELAEVIQAAEKACASEFIKTLPSEYQTVVGERGLKLSGGQRQRIALARAILKNSPTLVLDEATSAIDSESEALIQKGLDSLMQGKTVIAVAHRLSTLKSMDRIVVLEAGKIVEDGKPSELLSKENGKFKALWDKQKGGFIA